MGAFNMAKSDFSIHFGVRLNKYLQEYNYTHKKLSEKTGIALRTIDNYCVGEGIPSLYHAFLIAKALDISIDDLARGYL